VSAPGRFLLTFDVELLWGLFFDPRWRRRAERRHGPIREVFAEILGVLRRRDVRATFAFVGHLFLDRCERVEGRTHPEMPRPSTSPLPGDWYAFDPGTDRETDPLWYGRDLVEAVRAASPAHEIGAHGFSHAFLDSDRELARAEMRAARDAGAALGLELRSFVYPRNLVGFPEELPGAGFTHFREAWSSGPRIRSFLRRLRGAAPTVGRPRRVGDVVEVPAGIPILPAMGIRRIVPTASRLRELSRGLDRARDGRACLHLWAHPHNFVEGRSRMIRWLDRALVEVAARRQAGEIDVVTMGEVTA
jgi:peptidoglycan/xylan/chitin deacetylase (PgdA/CDA1 family)